MQVRRGAGAGFARTFMLLLVGLGAILIAAACGSSDEEETAATATGAATTAATGTAAAAATFKIGGAGIASNPRDIAGLFKIDDGVAMFKTRPASENRDGISKDTIKIGRHIAMTGPGAVVGPYTAAYHAIIDKVNAAGGVHGRKIDLMDRDDQFNPSIASQVVQELVERDKVFAMYQGLGTAPTSAVFDYLNAKGVPNVFALTGAAKFAEPTRPLYYTTSPSYIGETLAMGELIWKEKPGAKLAIVYQNDDYGKDNIPGLEAIAKAKGGSVVIKLGYDIGTPDLSSQIQQVVKSGADAVYLASYANEAVKLVKGLRETAGSKIPIYCSIVCTNTTVADGAGHANYDGVTGSITSLDAVIDLANPVVQASKKIADDTKQQFLTPFLAGTLYAEHLVRALELAGPDPTREGLILAMDYGFDGSWTCSVCLAPTMMGPQDHWASEAWQFVRYNGTKGAFEKVGTPIVKETSKGNGMRGNVVGFECTDKSPCPWKKP